MTTQIHFTSGETVRVDDELDVVQTKLNQAPWSTFESNGRSVAVRLDQVTHIETIGTDRASF